jgi:YbbR domain-containing protein
MYNPSPVKRKGTVNSKKLLARAVENWPAKVLSIALAMVLFVFHRMSNLEERFFSAPLQISAQEDMVPASPYPRMIRVSLRGEANSIYPIMEDDIEAFLDLTKHTETGTYRAPVQIRKMGTALGVEPLEITVDPAEISLELDRKISKYVPLVPSFQGYPAEGYELSSYTLSPNQVVVDGPLRIMEGLSELSTDIVDLGGRNEAFSLPVKIMNRDPLLIIRGDGTTEFRGVITRLVSVSSIDNLPVRISGLQEQFTAEPAVTFGSIRIGGSEADLGGSLPSGLFLNLNCGDIDVPGTYNIPVQVDVPAPFTLIRSEPGVITVEVRERETGAPEDTEG